MAGAGYDPAPDVFFRPASLGDLDRIHELEAAGYPADEAASQDRLAYRLQHAGEQFLVGVRSTTEGLGIIGFVCGTLILADRLTQDSMGKHDPDGGLLAIHSVCVDAAHRRQGIATRMIRAYQGYVQGSTPTLQEVRLICKEQLIPLYAGAGFSMVGPSDVVHGQDPWFEMRWAPSDDGEQQQQQQHQREEPLAQIN